jgi:hypothetical protein
MINKKKKKKSERFSSEPTLTIASINIEGITRNKEEILSDFCRVNNCDVLCIQETIKSITEVLSIIRKMTNIVQCTIT